MEEKKKLSYEELQRLAGELDFENRKLMEHIGQLNAALDRKGFEYSAFFLSNLFRVMDKAEMYSTDFVAWCRKQIEEAMYSFGPEQEIEEKDKDAKGDKEDKVS